MKLRSVEDRQDLSEKQPRCMTVCYTDRNVSVIQISLREALKEDNKGPLTENEREKGVSIHVCFSELQTVLVLCCP